MQIAHGIQAYLACFPVPPPCVVTVGNYDGVHRGHALILRETVEQARRKGLVSVVYTFQPHPRLVLRPDLPLPLLLTYEEKLSRISQFGLAQAIEEPFNQEFSRSSAEDFISHSLIRDLNAKAIVIGHDFRFGKDRGGNLETLARVCQKSGVDLTAIQLQDERETLSSSRIRRELLAGAVEHAKELLGYAFFYRGEVEHGEERGRKLGFPTANLKIAAKLVLPYGVYVTRSIVASRPDQSYPSVTHVGIRPTFQHTEDQPIQVLVETHLIGEQLDLYGETLEVRFEHRLREELRFQGLHELRRQIIDDIASAKAILQPIII